MTGGDDFSRHKWATFGKWGGAVAVVAAIVVGAANLDGFLSMVERITGSADAAEQVTTSAPAPLTTSAATSVIQPPPVTTTSATLPTSEDVPTSTRPTPAATTTVAQPTRAGALVITIKMGSGGKIGPSEYRVGSNPGANVDVYDDIGQLRRGCYPSWVLFREGTEIQKDRDDQCTSGGITMFDFGDSLDTPGSYRLSVTVVTDSEQSGSSYVDFTVT